MRISDWSSDVCSSDLQQENLRRLAALGDMMAQLGFRWGDEGKREGGVVEAVEADFQKQIWEVRKQGLNIMMSMKSEGKPVSFVEDRSEEHTSELQSLMRISYAVFCLKKKK